jgi:GT2 family glycosyltransferase
MSEPEVPDQAQPRSRAKSAVKAALARPAIGTRVRRYAHFQRQSAARLLDASENFAESMNFHTRGGWDDGTSAAAVAQLTSYYRHLRDHVATLPLQPLISVLVPVYRPDPQYLREALTSIALQTYPNWQACITDDASDDAAVTEIIEDFRRRHPDRVRVAVHATNGHISETSNTCLGLAEGEFVALLDHDDRLCPNALGEVVKALNERLDSIGEIPQILYSDERVVGPAGEYEDVVFFKPGWSPFLHLGVNYTTHLSVYQRQLLAQIGGFRAGLEGAQDHDLMLRACEAAETSVAHIPMVLYQWRSHPASTADSLGAKPYALTNGITAVTQACERRNRPASVTLDPRTRHYRTSFALPEPLPLVSIVIPTKDSPDLLRTCLDSILSCSTYPKFEIVLVDNNSTDPRTLQLYQELQPRPEVRVVEDPAYFNFARLINTGAAAATGEYLILLNNDTEVLTPDWIEQLLMYAQFPEVGAVGAKLLYPDGFLQHGGVVGSGKDIAHHAGIGQHDDDSFYFDYVQTPHETLAVTGAAMMVSAALFESVDGLDERYVPNAYGDVDLCLRFRSRGLANVYTPYAVLTHFESVTRRRNIELSEREYMRSTWGGALMTDPYVNPALVGAGSFSPERNLVTGEPGPGLFRRFLTAGSLSLDG